MLGLATEADLASLICARAEQLYTLLYTDAALVLDASARVAEVAGSGLVDVHVCTCVLRRRPCMGCMCRINSVHAWSCDGS